MSCIYIEYTRYHAQTTSNAALHTACQLKTRSLKCMHGSEVKLTHMYMINCHNIVFISTNQTYLRRHGGSRCSLATFAIPQRQSRATRKRAEARLTERARERDASVCII